MLPKCIVFNGVAVFKTPACAKKDRIVQFSEIHRNSNSTKWPSSGNAHRSSYRMEQTRRTMKPLVVEKVQRAKPRNTFFDSIKLPNRR